MCATTVVQCRGREGSRQYLDNRTMTPKQRLDRALQIRAALTALMTDDEADTYEVIDEHLTDYINELSLEYEATLDEL